MQNDLFPETDSSPDHDERIAEFLRRHGGAGSAPPTQHRDPAGLCGWTEVAAADGFRLRSDWSQSGGRQEMTFSELPPLGT